MIKRRLIKTSELLDHIEDEDWTEEMAQFIFWKHFMNTFQSKYYPENFPEDYGYLIELVEC